METWLRDGAVCIQGVTSGIVHFSVCVPHEGIQTAFMAWHSRRPISASVHCCFSVISHENQFNWCLLSDLGCRLSLFTWGSALRLRTGFVHLYLCRTFCIFLTRSVAQFLHNLPCIFSEFAQILSILPDFVKCSFGSIHINSEASAATGKGASAVQNFAHLFNDLSLMRLIWEEHFRKRFAFRRSIPEGSAFGRSLFGRS